MEDRRDWTGSRLGPYHLDRRYEDLEDPGGQLPAWHHVSTGALGAMVLMLMALVLWPRLVGSPERVLVTLDGPCAESVAFIDKQSLSPTLLGYPMPETPFAEQAKPPCGGSVYVELKGGCWYQGKENAPCPKGLAEYEGKCYVAVHKEKPEPRSVKH